MSEQPGSCSLIHKKVSHPIVKLKKCKQVHAKVMLNYNIEVRCVYTATIIDVSALTVRNLTVIVTLS